MQVVDMPSEDYHSHKAIGSSGLKRFQVSPLHYWADFLDPERERKDAKHFRIGRAWHTAIFEPEKFDAVYAEDHDAHPSTKRAGILRQVLAGEVSYQQLVGLPEGLSATTKEGKALVAEIDAAGNVAMVADDMAWIDAWLPKLAGRDVLPVGSIAKIQKMARIARDLPISRVVFDQLGQYGQAETSMFWVCPRTGVALKIRPDYVLKPCKQFPNGLIIDGKSTTDASEEGFGRQVWNLDYGLQAALYTMVFQFVVGTQDRPPFLWLAQEKDSPHAARYYGAGPDLIAHWDAKIAAMLPAVAECQRTGIWPGYPQEVQTLALPAWAQRKLEDAA